MMTSSRSWFNPTEGVWSVYDFFAPMVYTYGFSNGRSSHVMTWSLGSSQTYSTACTTSEDLVRQYLDLVRDLLRDTPQPTEK